MSEIFTVGVVGLGTMGAGIAEVFARAGLAVVGVEPNAEALDRGRGHLERSTGRAVARGKLSQQDCDAILGRITLTTAMADLAQCDVVIEAIPEQLEFKRELFTQLDAICPPRTILATNTSSLSVTDIAACTARPGQVIGMHFFNPAPVMRLVEVVHTVVTDPDVIASINDLAGRLGKTPVSVGDRAGFVANALLFGYLAHAVTLLDAGHVGRDDLDTAMKLGAGLPMGPLELLDLIGLDTGCQILATMHAETGDPLHVVPPLLRQLVAAGRLGRKSGQGFYDYDGPGGRPIAGEPASSPEADARRVGKVGIVGAGPHIDALTDALVAAGVATVVVDPEVLEDLVGCDLILDAEGSDAPATLEMFSRLAAVAGPGAVLATTGANVSVVDCAAASGHPERVVGLRWYTGPGGVRFFEIAVAVTTGPAAPSTVRALADLLGVPTATCRDRAGFIVDALLLPYLNDAAAMVEAGYASADDVDAAMTLGCGYPAGPIATADSLGLAAVLAGLRRIHAESGQPGFAPAPLIAHLVAAGRAFREQSS